ncbi:MAG: 3-methyl-2-oxobutanoate dehydrogenase subunit VorB [Victivallaceae bacterium]
MQIKSLLLSGNEAVVFGALLADCGGFFGYPITPAGEIIECAAKKFPRLGRTFIQAESEIAAINMVMGSAAAGKRAMTASSGLGISLKQEAVSYLAAMELPCLIVDVMRGGPGLGGIAAEQADYNQVVKGGGHGSYRTIVLAPASAQEMCDMGYEAFDLAEKYSIPVYILTDGIIGQMVENVTLPGKVKQARPDSRCLGYGFDRNNYFSSIMLDPPELKRHNQHLLDKYRTIVQQEQLAEKYFTADAEYVLVAYGISSRIGRQAVDELRRRGMKVGLLRPITLCPFPEKYLNELVGRTKRFIVLEHSCGQMIDDVRLAIECRRPVDLINEMGGVLITSELVVEKVSEIYGR